MSELEFEDQLVNYLTSGASLGTTSDGVSSGHYWKKIDAHTPEALWANFKSILEQHNQEKIPAGVLSPTEFAQVKRAIISQTDTPYNAGRFLYGLNGVCQVDIDLDNGDHVFLTVLNQNHVGAGDNIYQVATQVAVPSRTPEGQAARFDTTLLINGLPIIQIEEKAEGQDVDKALRQMHGYIKAGQYGDIFGTLQLLVAMTPHNAKYMAMTTEESFNLAFSFHWQDEESKKPVRGWKSFADQVLSVPMAHQLATNYMILDSTPNKQSIKAMRSYQVQATQRVLDAIKNVDFEFGGHTKAGYIWHTTGSGKTITSFKTAWLASRQPNVDKVIFLVDRKALTNQTLDAYRAYDPDNEGQYSSAVFDTKHTEDLRRQLERKSNGIVITSVQKLNKLINERKYAPSDTKNYVFIVDEAHRSTAQDPFQNIQQAFPRSAWIGYTGTPMFDETTKGRRTGDIFGPLLHSYTIRNAIADENVLGFMVDFETTLTDTTIREDILPIYFKKKYGWDDATIQATIDGLKPEDLDEYVESAIYDNNSGHVQKVVEDIVSKWHQRSSEGLYNAMLTTRTAPKTSSAPMALMYLEEFKRANEQRVAEGKRPLHVAVTFSAKDNHSKGSVEINAGLRDAMKDYNQLFGTSFGMDDVAAYTQDVTSRLNRTADGQHLDLVIVNEQLLTGFDAPQLNTLYVDRVLRNADLIQAYSRTNRIFDMSTKRFGRIVNYRWPSMNRQLMDEALAIYANEESADIQTRLFEDSILAPDYRTVVAQIAEITERLREMTDNVTTLPPSEAEQQEFIALEKKRAMLTNQAKQCTISVDPDTGEILEDGFDPEHPEEFLDQTGITPEQDATLKILLQEARQRVADALGIDVYELEFELSHVSDARINYDYLTQLIQDLMNQVHDGATLEDIEATEREIKAVIANSDDPAEVEKYQQVTEGIKNGEITADSYPVDNLSSDDIGRMLAENERKQRLAKVVAFRAKWGLIDFEDQYLLSIFDQYLPGKRLDPSSKITDFVSEAFTQEAQTLSQDESVKKLTRLGYRNALREALYDLGDDINRNR